MDTSFIGIIISFIGSFFGALGDKFVHDSYIKEKNINPKIYKKKMIWLMGILLSVVIDPIFTIIALYFTSAALVTPFAGVHILWNLIITNISLKIKTKLHQYMGSLFLITGIALIITFSEKKVDIHNMKDLINMYKQTRVIIYIITIFTIIIILLIICIIPLYFQDIANIKYLKKMNFLYSKKININRPSSAHIGDISFVQKINRRTKSMDNIFIDNDIIYHNDRVTYLSNDMKYMENKKHDPNIYSNFFIHDDKNDDCNIQHTNNTYKYFRKLFQKDQRKNLQSLVKKNTVPIIYKMEDHISILSKHNNNNNNNKNNNNHSSNHNSNSNEEWKVLPFNNILIINHQQNDTVPSNLFTNHDTYLKKKKVCKNNIFKSNGRKKNKQRKLHKCYYNIFMNKKKKRKRKMQNIYEQEYSIIPNILIPNDTNLLRKNKIYLTLHKDIHKKSQKKKKKKRSVDNSPQSYFNRVIREKIITSNNICDHNIYTSASQKKHMHFLLLSQKNYTFLNNPTNNQSIKDIITKRNKELFFFNNTNDNINKKDNEIIDIIHEENILIFENNNFNDLNGSCESLRVQEKAIKEGKRKKKKKKTINNKMDNENEHIDYMENIEKNSEEEKINKSCIYYNSSCINNHTYSFGKKESKFPLLAKISKRQNTLINLENGFTSSSNTETIETIEAISSNDESIGSYKLNSTHNNNNNNSNSSNCSSNSYNKYYNNNYYNYKYGYNKYQNNQIQYLSLITAIYLVPSKYKRINTNTIYYRIFCCTLCGMSGGFVNIFSEQIISVLPNEKFHMFEYFFSYILIFLTLFCLSNQLIFLNVSLSHFTVTSVIPLIMSNIVFFSSLTTIIMQLKESKIKTLNALLFSLGVFFVIVGILYMQYNINKILCKYLKKKNK
ncbi:conserved Plasmodium membrane protein, unknown function [Plasmodium sp. gorilla clade G2]|uniref:conserved Plasmodium membrane protein, unknown function n=1 Tax=Plasmodium sp. gorilla clade G2 TaxID=880535 RepID=UPI000D1FEBE8|nr:conserved Plasmodium membrane protein, unknown function [Plasmodium sp. gorilla clade G2]SOV13823.1 conserved Plasmodium membrane protein, unknown function [Plasmodium sp. gorilla clade G2]